MGIAGNFEIQPDEFRERGYSDLRRVRADDDARVRREQPLHARDA